MICGIIVPNYGWGLRFRGRWLQLVLKSHGVNLKISSMVNVYNPSRIIVGNNVYIGHGTYIGDGDINIEDEVVIGPYCSLTGGNHLFKDGSVRFGGYEYKPVTIGRGTWIGGHVTITAGVTIGSGCLIAAGAVVTMDIPNGMIAGGVPAKIIGENNLNSGIHSKNQDGMKK
jgi:maltose O-acetyltransferase